MCGIIGYVVKPGSPVGCLESSSGNLSHRDISSVLMVALERLSYRGYDSSGMAVVSQGEINYWKKSGKLRELKQVIEGLTITGSAGIAHTRWATHGEPSDINAHPHVVSCFKKNGENGQIGKGVGDGDSLQEKKVALIHNGIIENDLALRRRLNQENRVFSSATDSEVIAHLLAQNWLDTDDLIQVGRDTFSQLEGSYAIAALFEEHDHEILVARNNCPLMIGLGKEENYICSDLNVILFHTQEFIELQDGEMALVSGEGVKVVEIKTGEVIEKEIQRVEKSAVREDKQGYPHYMLKEIFEQPEICRKILDQYWKKDRRRIDFPDLRNPDRQPVDLMDTSRFLIQACGTSWHAGLIAKYWMEHLARIPTEVDISSELRYRTLLFSQNDRVLALSQSGETADTLACLREAKNHFLKVISFLNVEKSTMDRESNGVIYSHAGEEIGVASTKNYLAQLMTLYLFCLSMARLKNTLTPQEITSHLQALEAIPDHLETILSQSGVLSEMAERYASYSSFIFIGRGVNYPTALEGALKLKEISYLHATGYAAGELKHGPLALIDQHLPVICIVPNSSLYKKMISNIQEVKARKGRIIAIASENNREIDQLADEVFKIPEVREELSPLLSVLPLQLFSYYLSVKLGNDVDQPKNLAKSVTVE